MTRLMQILNTPVLTDGGRVGSMLNWMNYAVIPLVWMFGGLYRAWSTATTPFEAFLGTQAAVGIALLWPVFINALPRRESSPRK